MKYQVEDRVTIRADLDAPIKYGSLTAVPPMLQFKGKIMTVINVIAEEIYQLKEDGEHWNWTEAMFDNSSNSNIFLKDIKD